MKKILFLIAIALLSFSCTSVNKLKDYDMERGAVLFETEIPTSVRNFEIIYKDENSNEPKEKVKAADIFESVVTGIAEGFVNADVENKLRKVVIPEEIVQEFSQAVENSLYKYYQISSERDVKGEYDFISTSLLEECNLIVDNSGIRLRILSKNQIIDRKSGEIIWRKNISDTYPLRSNSQNNSETITNILKTIDLATITEDELAQAVKSVTHSISSDISESLRKSIADAKKGK